MRQFLFINFRIFLFLFSNKIFSFFNIISANCRYNYILSYAMGLLCFSSTQTPDECPGLMTNLSYSHNGIYKDAKHKYVYSSKKISDALFTAHLLYYVIFVMHSEVSYICHLSIESSLSN